MRGMPYAGVTDFTSREQIEKCKKWLAGSGRRLHAGAMISWKTINGVKTKTGWESIWLGAKDLQKMFAPDHDVLNAIHYADYEEHAPTKPKDVLEAMRRAGHGCNGFQFDMVWPNLRLLEIIRNAYPKVEIILQVGAKAQEQSTMIPWAERVSQYEREGLVDWVLVDYGMGRGTELDPVEALKALERLAGWIPEEKMACAGGLGPDTWMNLKPLLERFPGLSCDAQGRLRKSHSAKDPLEMERVEAYLKGVAQLGGNKISGPRF